MSHTARITGSALLALLLAAGLLVSPAQAGGSPQENCEGHDGTWDGANSFTGTCYYYPGDEDFDDECDAEIHDYRFFTYEGEADDIANGCHLIEESTTDEETTSEPSIANEGNDDTTTLSLGGGHNGSATFPAGSCPQKCTISSALPGPAKNSLPGDAIATIYVRVVDEGGTPGSGSYTVCFDNPDGASLTIYRYIGGVWTAVQAGSTSPICVTASGDGAFYLG